MAYSIIEGGPDAPWKLVTITYVLDCVTTTRVYELEWKNKEIHKICVDGSRLEIYTVRHPDHPLKVLAGPYVLEFNYE
jgi:hypothetical protein